MQFGFFPGSCEGVLDIFLSLFAKCLRQSKNKQTSSLNNASQRSVTMTMTAVIWRGQSTVIFVHLDYLKEVINKSV